MSDSLRLSLKVIPGASKEGVAWYGDLLKVKVRAPPEKGRANVAVVELLAARLHLPVSAITVVAGHLSPLKTVEIMGLSLEELKVRLAAA
jgi:uncharacterized protein